MVSQELLSELQVMLKEEFGMNTTPEQVFSIANGLIGYFELLSKYKYEMEDKK